MFTEKDLAQFEKKGISIAQVEEQIEKLKDAQMEMTHRKMAE